MKRTTTVSVLLAVLLVVGSGAALAPADATTASEATSPVYIMDGAVETAEISPGAIGVTAGTHETPALCLQGPVLEASPIEGPVGVPADIEPRFLL